MNKQKYEELCKRYNFPITDAYISIYLQVGYYAFFCNPNSIFQFDPYIRGPVDHKNMYLLKSAIKKFEELLQE